MTNDFMLNHRSITVSRVISTIYEFEKNRISKENMVILINENLFRSLLDDSLKWLVPQMPLKDKSDREEVYGVRVVRGSDIKGAYLVDTTRGKILEM